VHPKKKGKIVETICFSWLLATACSSFKVLNYTRRTNMRTTYFLIQVDWLLPNCALVAVVVVVVDAAVATTVI